MNAAAIDKDSALAALLAEPMDEGTKNRLIEACQNLGIPVTQPAPSPKPLTDTLCGDDALLPAPPPSPAASPAQPQEQQSRQRPSPAFSTAAKLNGLVQHVCLTGLASPESFVKRFDNLLPAFQFMHPSTSDTKLYRIASHWITPHILKLATRCGVTDSWSALKSWLINEWQKVVPLFPERVFSEDAMIGLHSEFSRIHRVPFVNRPPQVQAQLLKAAVTVYTDFFVRACTAFDNGSRQAFITLDTTLSPVFMPALEQAARDVEIWVLAPRVLLPTTLTRNLRMTQISPNIYISADNLATGWSPRGSWLHEVTHSDCIGFCGGYRSGLHCVGSSAPSAPSSRNPFQPRRDTATSGSSGDADVSAPTSPAQA